MNNPFEYIPSEECDEAYNKLLNYLESLKGDDRQEEIKWCRELEAGKMLGVLIAVDDKGERHVLYAFSGQIGDGGFHQEGFVGPVFDYLQPDGYFRKKEAEITRLNTEISLFEATTLATLEEKYKAEKEREDTQISEYKEKIRLSKLQRNERRKSGEINETELQALIRQSQFEKAELHRLKKRMEVNLHPLAEALAEANAHLITLKEKRRKDSESLQKWLFDNFLLLNARGESGSLSEIFAQTTFKIPPSGAGECCAPKLLQAAYLKGWQPISMAEYWYGKSKDGQLRIAGKHYPACRGKCLPVLRWMLQGLEIQPPMDSESFRLSIGTPEIIFENEWFCVVEKPSGMLSVPGRGASISVQEWLCCHYGAGKDVRMVHRLDQDTSGIIIAAFGIESYKKLQSLFATRKVRKTYIAILEGDYRELGLPKQGSINLPLSPDWLDRPRQKVDFEGGKMGLTDYEFLEVSGGNSRVEFHPLTGRTHQLRIHAASEQGLGMPIIGDRLYGLQSKDEQRLHLHAAKIEFTSPIDGVDYIFESKVPF